MMEKGACGFEESSYSFEEEEYQHRSKNKYAEQGASTSIFLRGDRSFTSDKDTSEEGDTDDDVSEWEHGKALKVMRKLLCKAKEASKQGKKRKNGDEHNISKKQAKVRSTPSSRRTSRETRRWENGEVSHLIEMLEGKPCLWDVFSPNYHLRDVRDKALQEIGDELGASSGDIKAKIMSLRAQLGREIGKVAKKTSGQGADEIYKPNWVFWEQLQFLRPFMQPGKSRDNMKSLHLLSKAAENSTELEEVPSVTIKDNSTLREGKENKKSIEVRKQELLETCINVLKEPIAKPVEQCHFSLYVAEKLQKFDRKTRMVAEKRITDILFDLEVNVASNQILSQNINAMNNEFSGDITGNGQYSYMTMLQQ